MPFPFALESVGKRDCRLDLLERLERLGVGSSGTCCPSGPASEARSDLLPARTTVRLGEARARASLRKVGRALKESWEARSYTRIAPAAPL